jgi:hypothetical protein
MRRSPNAGKRFHQGTFKALADAVEIRGGSITRVFARAELPLRLIDQPELLVPLPDQILLL